ncbi:hypothetical protein HELRODRAFT_120769, partial [Helobdella robusta]|uniref:UNC93-like protein n=1 Tax=Helobdella robusta TaxID=6412 RepID=T1EGQ6_HELRO
KNLYVICAIFFFSFASYMSLRNLQSSLNDAGGLGMLSLSCIYAFLFIGSIFTTTIVQRLRPKFSMLASLLGLLLYNISNFYPSYATLIPGACIAGFSLATIWTAQATYMANNASSYAQLTNQRFQDVLSNFHGIFFGFFQVSQMVGGVISSIIFSLNKPESKSNADDDGGLLNGMYNCPGKGASSFQVQFDPAMYYMMVAVFLSSMICSILILLFCLDPLEGALRNPRAGISIQLFSVFKMLTNPHILCILPLMSYTLLQTTFIFGEFNKAFVTCVLGIHMIGYLTVCLSLFSSIFAFATGLLQKYVGPEAIIVTGLLMHQVILVMMWVWVPSKQMPVIFFIIVAVWGAGDGMVVTQIISLLGTLFMNRKEAAFSTYKMAQSASAFLMFITGPYICTRVKVIITLTMNILAVLGYTTLRIRLRLKLEKDKKSD